MKDLDGTFKSITWYFFDTPKASIGRQALRRQKSIQLICGYMNAL